MENGAASSLLLLFFLTFFRVVLPAQDSLHQPVFSAFRGVVYKMPIQRLRQGYGPDILQLPVVDTIIWERIDFPDSDISVPFPGVSLSQAFGIVFTGTVEIPQAAVYQFATNSDDGSVLWINGKKVLDNDKDHRMQLRMDTIALAAGSYPVRLWYYQAYPTRYGIQLEGRYYRELQAAERSALPQPETTVFTDAQLHFEYNSSKLSGTARQTIAQFADQLRKQNIKAIHIIGHTDNMGNAGYNQKLSEDRATAVFELLAELLNNASIRFSTEGSGDRDPLDDNSTAAGRANNRRVEIRIE